MLRSSCQSEQSTKRKDTRSTRVVYSSREPEVIRSQPMNAYHRSGAPKNTDVITKILNRKYQTCWIWSGRRQRVCEQSGTCWTSVPTKVPGQTSLLFTSCNISNASILIIHYLLKFCILITIIILFLLNARPSLVTEHFYTVAFTFSHRSYWTHQKLFGQTDLGTIFKP